jgi:hypothetical protein
MEKTILKKKNIFAYAKMYQAQCTRVEEHRSFNFSNNIIVFDKGAVLNGAWNKIDIFMDHNLYWNTGGNTYDFSGKSFKEWQQTGHDMNSFIENPNFNDASGFDFGFKNNRSIKKVDFKSFDYSKAEVYGSAEWLSKSKLTKEVIEGFDKAVEENMKGE